MDFVYMHKKERPFWSLLTKTSNIEISNQDSVSGLDLPPMPDLE